MDPTKASDFDRRTSRRISRRVSVHAGGDGGDGDDDLEMQMAAMGIADGFAPTTAAAATAATDEERRRDDDDDDDAPTPSASTTPPASLAVPVTARTNAASRPSSIAKPPPSADTFALRHDGAMGPVDDSLASQQSSATASSEASASASESPYEGPSGPSFPYQMYPQNVRVARTMSVTTASTEPTQETPYAGPRGPAHPYGLYPQNPAAGPSTAPVAAIPVGFPGFPAMADNYQRQLGPDGEEIGDMIGPLGHTEQLPPYSRYPDEAYTRKAAGDQQSAEAAAAAAAVATASTVPSASAPAAGATVVPASASAAAGPTPIPGAGGIGLAPRNPEFDDPDSPRSRHSSRSFTNSDTSQHEVNTAARAVSEKQKPLKGWQLFARRRVWGIVPYWAICLLIMALLLMGIVLGAVIGAFYAKHKRPPPREDRGPPDSQSQVTVTVDATPIPTPPDLPPIPTGTFNLPLTQNRAPNSCFNDTLQAQAWSCNIWPFNSGLTIVVSSNPPGEGVPPYNISINCNQSNTMTNNVFWYGEQPPMIPTPQPMMLVNDTLDPIQRGPAWFRMVSYSKTVIVQETLMPTPTPTPGPTPGPAGSSDSKMMRRRWNGHNGFGNGDIHRKNVAQPGDKPWVCTWPDTVLEVFIYPRQNASFALRGGMNASGTITPGPGPQRTSAPSAKESAAAGLPTTSAAAAATSGPSVFDIPQPIPAYPKVVKIEERRMPRSPQPTCVQYQIKQDPVTGVYSSEPIFDPNGNHVQITIAENETPPQPPPPPPPPSRRDVFGDPLVPRDGNDMSDCGCLWLLT